MGRGGWPAAARFPPILYRWMISSQPATDEDSSLRRSGVMLYRLLVRLGDIIARGWADGHFTEEINA